MKNQLLVGTIAVVLMASGLGAQTAGKKPAPSASATPAPSSALNAEDLRALSVDAANADRDARSWDLLRPAIEANVLNDDPFIVLRQPCAGGFDDWSRNIDYDYDNGVWEDILHKDDSGVLYTKKVFSQPGAHRIAISAWFHCRGTPPGWSGHVGEPTETTTLTVYPQIPVQGIAFQQPTGPTVQGGKSARLKISLAGFAPPSGTRVWLVSNKQTVVPLNTFVTVAEADKDSYYIDLQTVHVLAPVTVRIDAHSTLKIQSAFLRVTP